MESTQSTRWEIALGGLLVLLLAGGLYAVYDSLQASRPEAPVVQRRSLAAAPPVAPTPRYDPGFEPPRPDWAPEGVQGGATSGPVQAAASGGGRKLVRDAQGNLVRAGQPFGGSGGGAGSGGGPRVGATVEVRPNPHETRPWTDEAPGGTSGASRDGRGLASGGSASGGGGEPRVVVTSSLPDAESLRGTVFASGGGLQGSGGGGGFFE